MIQIKVFKNNEHIATFPIIKEPFWHITGPTASVPYKAQLQISEQIRSGYGSGKVCQGMYRWVFQD